MKKIALFLCFFILAETIQAQVARDSASVAAYVDSLLLVCKKHESNREYTELLQKAQLAEDAARHQFGKLHSLTANAINRVGIAYQYLGELEKCEQKYLEALEIRAQVFGKNHIVYAGSLNNVGNILKTKGAYKKAIPYLQESLDIRGKVKGKKSEEYAAALENLALNYTVMGLFSIAEPLFKEALNNRLENLGENNQTYIRTLGNLGYLYLESGDYFKSEYYLKLVEDKISTHFGENNTNYEYTIFNLGKLYLALGQIEKADFYIQKARGLRALSLGQEHWDFAYTLDQLARVRTAQGKFEEAKSLYEESLKIFEKQFSKQSADYVWVLSMLAEIHYVQGSLSKAIELYGEVIQVREQTLGKENYSYAYSLYRLGELYSSQKEYLIAEKLIAEALAITKQSVGGNHPNYFNMLTDLGHVYAQTGKKAQADSLYTQASTLNLERMRRNAAFLSADEMSNLIAACPCQAHLSKIYAYASERVQEAPMMMDFVWENAYFFKGFLLENVRAIERAATLFPDSIRQIYVDWKETQAMISNVYTQPISDPSEVKKLEENAAKLEKNLVQSAKGFIETREQVSWRDVQKGLKKGELALEFVHIQKIGRDGISDNNDDYAALILTPNDTTPHFIPLFEERQLAALLEKTGDDARATTNLYAARTGEGLLKVPTYGAALYNLIWKPLDSLLQANNVNTVYFSPSGLLHRVAFAALPTDNKHVLADRYQLHQMGSTRSLVVKTPQPVPDNYSAAVFGGVTYERSAVATDSTASEITDNRLWTYIDRPRAAGESFDYLPGTAAEAARLTRALTNQRVRVQTHTGAQATEEALKALGRDTVKSPDILHIATHGFFFPDPEKRQDQRLGEENAFKWNENPLFRSGLALAGANAAWNGQPTPASREDGIATAYEISHLNLSNTKLVVLSACESGLGDIKGSEGVYGLQRAFKMAGADFLLVSLWQVPDTETVEFMDAFYGAWLKGKTIHEAFARAQKKMRKKYKEVYKWGAWVLVE